MIEVIQELKEMGADVNVYAGMIYIKLDGTKICCKELAELFERIMDSYEVIRLKRIGDIIYMTILPYDS